MVWDLRGALLAKEEFESARLQNFEFRHRARAMRLLAERIGEDAQALVVETAEHDDEAILSRLAQTHGDLTAAYHECQSKARAQLISEIGDPTPHRLG
jgi:hypothetical protein